MGYFGSGINLEKGSVKQPGDGEQFRIRLSVFNNGKWWLQHRILSWQKFFPLADRKVHHFTDDDSREIFVQWKGFSRNPLRGATTAWREIMTRWNGTGQGRNPFRGMLSKRRVPKV